MKKTIYPILLLLIIGFLSCEQKNHFGTGWDEFSLIGEPKRVTIIRYDENLEDGDFNSKKEVEFSNEGKIKFIKTFHVDTLSSKSVYVYSSTNKLDSIIRMNGGDNKELYTTVFKYTNENNIRIWQEGQQSKKQKFNLGKKISEEFVNKKNGITNNISFEYDENGNRVITKYHVKYSEDKPVSFFECKVEILDIDKNGNWILAKSECRKDDQPPHGQYTLKRIIEY